VKNDRAVATMTNAPIFGIDVHGNMNKWKNKTAKITDFPKKEAFDEPLMATLIVPKLRHSVQHILDNAFKGMQHAATS
jgi:hypothetical protein